MEFNRFFICFDSKRNFAINHNRKCRNLVIYEIRNFADFISIFLKEIFRVILSSRDAAGWPVWRREGVLRKPHAALQKVQPDQINMAVFFWYLVKSDSSVCYCTHKHKTCLFIQGTRNTRPFITGHFVLDNNKTIDVSFCFYHFAFRFFLLQI